MNSGNDHWLNAPTFAPLESPGGLGPRRRNQRLTDLLGERPKEPTTEETMAKLRRSLTDEKDGHSSDDNAVGSLGVYPEGD